MIHVSLQEFVIHSIGHFLITLSLILKASLDVHPSYEGLFNRPRFDREAEGNFANRLFTTLSSLKQT